MKAASNLEKHGIDFQGAVRIFETEAILWVYSERQGEGRWKAIGVVEGVEVAVVYTWREDRRRIISARRAGRNERQAYRAALASRSEEGQDRLGAGARDDRG